MFYCVSPQYWMNSPRYRTKYTNLKKLQNFIIYDKMPVGLNEAKSRVIYLRTYKLIYEWVKFEGRVCVSQS